MEEEDSASTIIIEDDSSDDDVVVVVDQQQQQQQQQQPQPLQQLQYHPGVPSTFCITRHPYLLTEYRAVQPPQAFGAEWTTTRLDVVRSRRSPGLFGFARPGPGDEGQGEQVAEGEQAAEGEQGGGGGQGAAVVDNGGRVASCRIPRGMSSEEHDSFRSLRESFTHLTESVLKR